MPSLYLDRLPTGPVALFELLQLTTGDNHRWDRRGRLIRLRSKTWYLDRPREVPLGLVRRWVAQVDRQGALPMAEYAEMVATLKGPQLETLSWISQQVGLPHELGLAGLLADPLRFYAALSPTQQQSLWAGGQLSALRLSDAQQALFLKALRALTGRRPTDPEQIALGRITLTTRPMIRTREIQGERVVFRDERVAPGVGSPPPAPNARADAPRRYPILSVMLLLECGQDLRGALDLEVPAAH